MGMVGRPRIEARERYACGKAKSKPEVASPAMVRRIINEARRGAADPALGSVIGQLRLRDLIDTRQMSAGLRYAELCADYDRMKGIPRRSAASPSYQAGLRRTGGNDAEDEGIVAELLRNGGDVRELAKKNARLRALVRIVTAHEAAQKALLECGQPVWRLVREVAIYDRTIDAWHRPQLIRGLDALMAHFDLTGFRK